MFKKILITLLFLSLPTIGFGFAGGGLGDMSDDLDSSSNASSDSSDEDDGDDGLEEMEKVKRVFEEVKGNSLVHKVGGGTGCLQGPSGKLYKESMSTINGALKHLNDFESDGGKKWYIVSC